MSKGYDDYESRKHKQRLSWALLGVLSLTGIGWLLGSASHQSKEQEHRFQIECIQAGGTMYDDDERSGFPYCVKAPTRDLTTLGPVDLRRLGD